jgi:hypothetical protein
MKGIGLIAVVLLAAACSVEVVPSSPPVSPEETSTASLPAPSPEPIPLDVPMNPGFGLPYACAGEPFDVRTFSLPPTAETSSDPAAEGLRKTLLTDPMLPRSGWWMTNRSETAAEFAARDARNALWYVRVEAKDGAWGIHSWGGCGPVLQIAGLSTVVWKLDPDAPLPDPDSRVIRAVVTESCVPDPLAVRLQPPIVRSTADLVLIAFTARPGAGGHARLPIRFASVQRAPAAGSGSNPNRPLFDHCAGESTAVVEVDLGEPLGDRLLVDGSSWPGRDVRQPVEP